VVKLAVRISLTAALLGACKPEPAPLAWQTVLVDSLYALRMPQQIQRVSDMHDYASLQAYAPEDEFYVLGIEDAKEKLGAVQRRRLKLEGYHSFLLNTVFERVDSSQLIAAEARQLAPGLDLICGDYYAYSQSWGGVPLLYRIAAYESPSYYLQLVIWLPYENACERQAWMDSLTYSLRFVGGG
jgi:hypothetical protein